MKRYLLLWLFAYGIVLGLSANPVDKNTAQKVAKNFYVHRMPFNSFPGIASTQIIRFRNSNSYYAINLKNQKGFVLVAADDISKPVWAYSFEGSFQENLLPENVARTIEEYNRQLEYLRNQKIEATSKIKSQWVKYKKAVKSKGSQPTVGPLLTTVWSQGCYYNDQTPIDSAGDCYHVVTGCVATAMAQVLNYYQYPNHGSGSHTYNSNYGLLTANFGASSYDWASMSDTLNVQSSVASVSAVAQLISHCGIAVDMNYSAGGSGAFSQDAANAFAHYFNYDNGLQLLHRANYPDSVWEQMVKDELDSLHPLYYDGSGTGGHAFVCDGYQGGDYFHFNWGWSGNYNGYYLLTNLNPGGTNFSNYCGAVFGMKPGVVHNCNGLTDTLTKKSGNISDGSYSADYANNSSCSWLINPQNAVSISLEFYTFDLQAGDSLFIYDGSDNSANLIAAYSGNTLPTSVASSAGKMYLEFVTDNQNTASGWSAFYRSEFCSGLKVYNAPTGSIDDGSGAESYNDNTNCYWLISDSANNPIHLDFKFFQTELSYDYVDVYDGTSTSANQLGSFSGNTLPPSLVSTAGKMLIHFHSDGGVNDQGWAADYYTCGQAPAPLNRDTAYFCTNDSLVLSIPSYVDSFVWVLNGTPIPSITSDTWEINQSGTYKYIVYSNVCPASASDDVVVVENALPVIDLGADTTLCNNLPLMLNAPTGFSSYLWSTGDTVQSISVNAGNGMNQTISLWVSDSNQCSNTDQLQVQFVNCTDMGHSSKFYFELFPNPTQDNIQLRFPVVEQRVDVNVFDSSGHMILHRTSMNVNSMQINTSKMASGVYYIEVKQDNVTYRKSFIKQ